jgi:hypothetical protein
MRIKPENDKNNLIRWRGIYNSKGWIVRANKLAATIEKEGKVDDGVLQKRAGGDDSKSQ